MFRLLLTFAGVAIGMSVMTRLYFSVTVIIVFYLIIRWFFA